MSRIALVDDDRNILTSVSMTLEAEGFEVETYNDGQQALDAFNKKLPDMAVLDIKMPRMDGMDLLQRLRQKTQMPVIFLTSKDDEIDEVLGLRMGADDYVKKPFSQRLLVERIRTLLRRQDAISGDTVEVTEENKVMERGQLTMDPLRHAVKWKGRDVSLTVTEKGYCHAPSTGKLDFTHPDIVADLADPERPKSAPGFLCRALDRRRKAGLPPFTVLCCDNLPENGAMLRGIVLELAGRMEEDLAAWIEAECSFPCAMVDRIVPATTEADIERLTERTGVFDAAPVMHEPFRQWVIEDRFTGGARPDFGAVGVEMVDDVRPYEHMKLRCLNGTHSALAYLGYLSGAENVSEAVARPALASFVRHLWSKEIIPVLTPPPGVDLHAYADALMDRYSNPRIRHRTWQIAMDGSLKLPQRLLGSIAENLAAGQVPEGLFLVVAAWMRYTSATDENGETIDVRDPMADRLRAIWEKGGSLAEIVQAYLAIEEIFPVSLASEPAMHEGLERALGTLIDIGAEKAAAHLTEHA